MKRLSKSLEETKGIAKEFLNNIEANAQGATVLALEGDLGSGKTAFAQAIGKILEVVDDIHSPTFVIEKIYSINFKGFKKLVHVDAYRLESDSELLQIGWEELIKKPENLILIEWPGNVRGAIPTSALYIHFKFIDETARQITYED